MVDRGVRLLGAMKFHIGQYVTRNDSPGVGVLGRVVGSGRIGLDAIEQVRVRWFNGYIDTYDAVQLRIVCPECAKIEGFDTEQRARLKKECDICR
jgi:hypothetical protein